MLLLDSNKDILRAVSGCLRVMAWFYRFVCLCLLLLCSDTLAMGDEVNNGKQILIIHSHDIAYSRFFGLSQGFQQEMNNGKYLCNYTQFELKVKENCPEEITKRFNPCLDQLEAGFYDAVLVIGNPAQFMITDYLGRIHPRTVVYFMGVLMEGYVDRQEHKLTIGSDFPSNMPSTFELALQLFPERRQAVLLTEKSIYGDVIERQLNEVLSVHPLVKLKTFRSTEASDQEVLKYLEDNRDDSFVLFYSWGRDSVGLDGYLRDMSQILFRISEKTETPVFVTRDFLIQYGVVGGDILWMRDGGRVAAKTLKDYFNGGQLPERVQNVVSHNSLVVDWEMMNKFSIPMSRVPSGVVFLNRPVSFWEQHEVGIITSVCIIFFCLSLLLYFLFLHSRYNQKRVLEFAGKLSQALQGVRAAERAKSAFLSTMSHEIRTPLSVVIGVSQLLQDEKLTKEERSDYLSIIRFSSNTLLQLINDILDLSKLEEGKMKVNLEKTELGTMLMEIKAVFSQRANEKNLQLACDCVADMPVLWIDAARVRQVIFNLLGNAIKFTSKGSITVHAEFLRQEDHKGELSISVADTGIGMSEEFQKQMFQLFVQEERRPGLKQSRDERGTGLGLGISLRLAQAMGGNLTVKSQIDVGSTFTLKLSGIRYEEAQAKEITPVIKEKEELDVSALDFKILLVDDMQLNLMVLDKMMRKLGFVPWLANSGTAALQILKREKIDLVFTDLKMPGMDGIELSREIRKLPIGNAIKIFVLMADVYAKDDPALSLMDGVFLKPFTLVKFKKLFNSLVVASSEAVSKKS